MEILREHSSMPGQSYNDCLIIGDSSTGVLNETIELKESTDSSSGILKFKGKLQEADRPNKNKRIYPKNVLSDSLKNITESLKHGGLLGELDHPENSIIHFENSSHVFTKVWWDKNILMGEGFVLDTPYGRILKTLINSGVRIGMSSRGVGNGKVDENGLLVIGEGYKLITFDAVADPSTFAAYQKQVKSENISLDSYKSLENNKISSIKEESKNINNNINRKEVLIAALGGLITQKTNSYIRG